MYASLLLAPLLAVVGVTASRRLVALTRRDLRTRRWISDLQASLPSPDGAGFGAHVRVADPVEGR